MRFSISLVAALLSTGVVAFPATVMDNLAKEMMATKTRRQATSSLPISRDEGNCGVIPCLVFDASEQFISVSGQHAYASPAADQIRGPCPGLNAAANHGYLPRSGVATIPDTITGLGEAYGMGVDLAGFLAAYAVIFDGDIISGTWSIGGPEPFVDLAPGLIGRPQGISYSHNKYEGDTSMTRSDAYINNGDAHSLIPERFAQAFATGMDDDRYTLDKFRQDSGNNQLFSIANNPYYFAPLFSTTLVAPAAYNFVVNFMSNHTAENPNGYLDGSIFKQFFAVTGDYPNFEWHPGQERIPENWYRRTSERQYLGADVFDDLIVGWLAYPDTFRLGGNVNGVNSYEGVNPFDVSKGTYSMDSLFQGDNFACFFFQTQQQAVPDEFKGGLNAIASVTSLLAKYSNPIYNEFTCPQLKGYDSSPFNKYPGRTYSPTGPATNY